MRMPIRAGRAGLAVVVAVLVGGSALSGCAAANKAVGTAASATATAASATASAASTVATTTVDAVISILPFPETHGPEWQREQMLEQAGPHHFQNEGFKDGRDEMRQQQVAFEEHRSSFVFEDFKDGKARFRNGNVTPARGFVLGGSTNDPDVARALLLAAASQGLPVVGGVQPVLAQLLPAFGN